jgi:hypothetical protein
MSMFLALFATAGAGAPISAAPAIPAPPAMIVRLEIPFIDFLLSVAPPFFDESR